MKRNSRLELSAKVPLPESRNSNKEQVPVTMDYLTALNFIHQDMRLLADLRPGTGRAVKSRRAISSSAWRVPSSLLREARPQPRSA
jgi:hypothetical protein